VSKFTGLAVREIRRKVSEFQSSVCALLPPADLKAKSGRSASAREGEADLTKGRPAVG